MDHAFDVHKCEFTCRYVVCRRPILLNRYTIKHFPFTTGVSELRICTIIDATWVTRVALIYTCAFILRRTRHKVQATKLNASWVRRCRDPQRLQPVIGRCPALVAATCFPCLSGGCEHRVACFPPAMSRRPQQPPIETAQPEVEEEEALSGVEEGDEVMEDVQDADDGYSAYNPFLATTPATCSIPFPVA